MVFFALLKDQALKSLSKAVLLYIFIKISFGEKRSSLAVQYQELEP